MFDEDANRRRFSNQAVSVTRRLEIGAHVGCYDKEFPEHGRGVDMQNYSAETSNVDNKVKTQQSMLELRHTLINLEIIS